LIFVEGVEEAHQAGCISILQIGLRDLGLTQREADQRGWFEKAKQWRAQNSEAMQAALV
jgi:hypothetical protein